MLERLKRLSKFIGNTPLKELDTHNIDLFAKLEYTNFSGSSKDRAAYSILYNAIENNNIDEGTTVIASSSGNLAISLSFLCKYLQIKFIPVIDLNVNADNEGLLRLVSSRVVKVDVKDELGGYLLNRIKTVEKLCREIDNSFCADQYGDENNYKGYFKLAEEVYNVFGAELDYVFVAVSSSGAITGISRYLKTVVPEVQIIGVDVEGSVIFGKEPARRLISGIGASKRPPIIDNAIIDDVMYISEPDIIKGCKALLDEQVIFAGASSGAVYQASRKYFENRSFSQKPKVLLIFPDRGHTYLDTVYNAGWTSQNFNY
ncbi:pyridoxal-phosphate dependent enzyme [Dyadobacter diqingensis]|uniref:pyridoxal-phosphate dependent enzyme n=1 Tax=Dyadobacter diqingensis TaxID=2938121 RepID=UPI0020C32FC3|nr:pyridoxal-phosphate dependent enzyme [Dyadobacter diqingensis]